MVMWLCRRLNCKMTVDVKVDKWLMVVFLDLLVVFVVLVWLVVVVLQY